MTSRPRPIEVVIDEMTLHGFEHRHGERIASAFRGELAAALTGWQPGGPRGIDRIDAGSFVQPRPTVPEAVGKAVARHVRHALDSGRMPTAEPGIR
jgi:hypothetical protein